MADASILYLYNISCIVHVKDASWLLLTKSSFKSQSLSLSLLSLSARLPYFSAAVKPSVRLV